MEGLNLHVLVSLNQFEAIIANFRFWDRVVLHLFLDWQIFQRVSLFDFLRNLYLFLH